MKPDNLLFSVIIPTYNRASFVVKTIGSVLNQTYSNFEIIVVDDGSSDNTGEVITSINDPKIRYFKIEHQERGAARNYGTIQAQGDYIVFIDSDDIMYNHCLELAGSFIIENNQPEIFHLPHEIRNEDGKLIETTIHLKNLNKLLIKGNPLACINVFLRNDISKRFLFKESTILAGFEDWELWLRIAAHYKIKHGKIISGLMLNHPYRSSNQQDDKVKLINGVEALMQTVLSNEDIVNAYKSKINLFKCGCYTYLALHLALTSNHKRDVVKYLLKGLKQNPLFIFERRFGGIIKHLLFSIRK